MQPLRPILTRDLRNQRWLLLAWIAMLLASVASRVIGPHLSVASTAQDFTMLSLGSLAFAHLVLMILGIALIVQTDVVVGTTAFWLTRPIARTTMLRAKLLSSFVIIVLPALVVEAILMAAYGMSPLTIVLALLQQAWIMLMCVLLIALGAAATRTLPQLLLLIIVAFGAWILWRMLDAHAWPRNPPIPESPLRTHDPSAGIIWMALITAGLLVAIAFQYVRRQALLALLIGAVSIIATTESGRLYAHVSLFGGEPAPPQEAWTAGSLILQSGERLTWPALRKSARNVAYKIAPRTRLVAPLTIEGLPANYTVEPFTAEATLRVANDTIRSARDDRYMMSEGDWRTMIIDVNDDRLRAAGNGPAAYHAVFDLGLTRRDRLATVPVATGAGANDGARRFVVRSFLPLGGPVPRCLIRFDAMQVELLTQWRRSPRLDINARLADGTPAHAVVGNTLVNSFARYPFEALPPGFHPFQITIGEVEVYAPRCEGLLLDIDRVSYAGRLLRTVDLPEVNVNELIAMESRERF